MAQIIVERVRDGDIKTRPIFEEIERRLEKVRRRAFELFQLRGGEAGREIEDWLQAEREVLGWPPMEMQENDREFAFQVPLDDFDVSRVTVIVTPSEILVHANGEAEKRDDQRDGHGDEFGPTELYRRIELPNRIKIDRTKATLDNGKLRIRAAKAEARTKQASTRTA